MRNLAVSLAIFSVWTEEDAGMAPALTHFFPGGFLTQACVLQYPILRKWPFVGLRFVEVGIQLKEWLLKHRFCEDMTIKRIC